MVQLSVLFSMQDKTMSGCSLDKRLVRELRHSDHLCMCIVCVGQQGGYVGVRIKKQENGN